MWDRKDLKEKAKAAFRANRITCIFVAFLMIITGTMGNSGVPNPNYITGDDDQYYEEGILQDLDGNEVTFDEDLDFDDGLGAGLDDNFGDNDTYYYDDSDMHSDSLPGYIMEEGRSHNPTLSLWSVLFSILPLALIPVAIILALAVSILLLSPLSVGLWKFFIDNRFDSSASLGKGNLGMPFGADYKNIVLAKFTTSLYLFLWTLLLIVPGIIKAYEWRQVNFLLAENPGMSGAEARRRSSKMMDGSKMDTFVLDLSFIGWYIVGALTLGIGNLIWTNPYVAATDTELYFALKDRGNGDGAAGYRTDSDRMVADDIAGEITVTGGSESDGIVEWDI